MRIDPREVSSQSLTGKSWGPAADAPTFLPNDELVLPLRAPKSDSVITSAPKKKPARVIESIDRSIPHGRMSQRNVVTRGASQSTIKPARQSAAPHAVPHAPQPLAPAPQAHPRASAAPAHVQASPPEQAPGPRAQHVPEIVPPFVQFEGGASFDPLAIPLPPELAPSVYGWLRRLALQADLADADRLLRDAFADLTSSLSVVIIYASPDGLHSLGAGDELPKDMQPIIAVAKSRRALVGAHSALLPIATTTETVAVVQLVRNARQPAFNMIDQVTMAGLARESASVMHHLVVEHLQRRTEAEADKKSLYRPEALESHRRRGQEGSVTELSPGWIRRTYQILILALVVVLSFTVFIEVPTYSSGSGVIYYRGTPVTSPAPGTVEKIHAGTGMSVSKGALLVKLKADKEEADLEQARTELEAALQQYAFDSADETVKKSLVSAQAATKRAEDALEQRNVRATTDGTVYAIRAREGAPLNFGDPILTIVPSGTEPEVWAYLPGNDRPRLHPGQRLQVELLGYQKTRERATIYEIDRAVTGPSAARSMLGPEIADALKLAQDGSYVLVKAKLPKRTFTAKGKRYHYHHGMPAKTEVRVESKRFIVTLLPSLEKYIE